ncbi:glycosyltransferase family 1 protein [Candidatus Thorarchaeota archaeon]|nr:MAG: glycosyltransferase family 1 protein [Candidatus Thorarchaeota archaeon]
MRIGMVSKFSAPDGLCIRANAVLKGLVERGHEVHAITQSAKVEGISDERLHRFRAVQLNPHFSLDSISSPKKVVEVCKQFDIDVLHIQMNSGSTEFLLPYFKSALPSLVVTFHLAYAAGGSLYTTLFGIAWRASLFASKKYDEVILVDPSQKPYFLNQGFSHDKLSVIRNGVEINLFRPDESKRTDDDVTDFVYVGRLSYDKGVHILLDAFQEYHKENSNTRLTLIGDGMLKHQIGDISHNGSIQWIGVVDHDKIPNILQKMDAFVIPQNIGGLGLSVMEAMSCGLPVITTAIGETINLLGDHEGILVKPKSVFSVVNAMRTLSEDKDLRLRMGRNCRKKIEEDYSWHNQIGLIEEVYKRAIERSR